MNVRELALASVYLPPCNDNAPTSAWLGHLPFAGWLMEALQPRIFVELGTHYGDSYFSFCQAVRANSLNTNCFAVDTWQGDEHAGEYEDEVFNFVRAYHDSRFSSFSTLMRMRFDDALQHFSEGSVDLLHIDGLHTYEAVKHDFETWKPKLSDRAVVIFHDTAVRQGDFGVWRYWEELIAQYPHIRFDHSNGLGVLFVGQNQPPIVANLLNEWNSDGGAALIRRFFESIGQRYYDLWERRQMLAQKDERIAALEADGASRHEYVQQLEQHAADLQQHAANLQQRGDDLEQRVAELDEAGRNLRQEIEAQQAHSRHLQAQLDDVLSSTSWRVTSPLRKVGGVIRR